MIEEEYYYYGDDEDSVVYTPLLGVNRDFEEKIYDIGHYLVRAVF